ncbi:MAG: elongation factor P [Spirochaetia bacterium]|nr:elongation factor P [Spirochaetota bacterium]MCX8097050.1 elongation factor P [Spirochaetota bacterium]MDW8111755.1 elongation factor P [Spirochaetia bacterium]
MPGVEAASLRRNNIVFIDGKYYLVIDNQHIKLGRGGANSRLKLKSIETGNIIEKTFGSDTLIEKPDVEIKEMSVVYIDQDNISVMDNDTYEQYEITKQALGDTLLYVKEGVNVTGYINNGRIITILPPDFIELEVVDTDPGLRGDTVSGGSKPAKLETGLVIQVPLFVQIGDKVKVDTRDNRYVERVK